MPLRFQIKDLGKIFKAAFKSWWGKDPFRESAVIAYYAVFSLPALLVLVISAAGFFFDEKAVNSHILDQVTQTMGQQTSEQVKEMLAKATVAKTSVWATIIGIAVLLIGSTGVFVQLQKNLNNIWEVKAVPQKGIWPMLKTRLFSFGLIMSIAFLLIVSLVISTILSSLSNWISADSSQFMIILFEILNFVISLIILSALFALMFKILPDVKIKWREVMVGGLITGILFTIGKTALAFYFSKAEPGEGYGAAASIILILLWVSYSSMILFFGAEFTRAHAALYSGEIKPSEFAVKKDDAPKEAA